MVTVAQLIAHLKKFPKGTLVAVPQWSEHRLLTLDDVATVELCEPRSDGWLQNKRPDIPFLTYLVI